MEGGKHAASSPSSFTSDLFGSKDPFSSSSSAGIFGSIFAPNSPKVFGRESLRSDTVDKKKDSASQAWNAKPGAPDAIPRSKEGESHSPSKKDMSSFYNEQREVGFNYFSDAIPRSKEGESHSPSKKDMSSFYNEQRVQPCHLSSSIYYGGQDIYSNPQTTQSSGYSTEVGFNYFSDAIPRSKEGESHSPSKKDMSSFYNEQRVQPCHLSSSIYYGGQDIYSNPQTTQSSGYSTFNKDGGEDDSGSASRGNWWQGGLYY